MLKKSETYRYTIEAGQAGERLDKALSALNEELSRARVQGLMDEGQVMLNGLACKTASKKLSAGDIVTVHVPEPVSAEPQPEDIALNVVYEDDDLIVINKQAGLVVHPGAGNWTGTLVNALLYHCGGSLSGIGGVMRPGIVHRLDKDTSGVMVVAKHDKAHKGLAAQLEDRSLSRIYIALVFKVPVPLKGRIDQPLARHHVHRQKMTVNRDRGKEAATRYHIIESFGESCALVECMLESGRTHQIRVHMEYIKHPLIGDPVYGPQPNAVRAALGKEGYEEDVIEQVLTFPRQALQAQKLSFIHPVSGEEMSFEVPLADDMLNLLKLLEKINT